MTLGKKEMAVSVCCKNPIDVVDGTFQYFRCSCCWRPCCVTLLTTDGQQKENAMPAFSQESFSKLSTAHRDLQVLFYEIIKTFDCTIINAHRDQVDQDADYAAGRTKLKYPDSKHNSNPAMAVDVMPYLDNGKGIEWDKNINTAYFAGYVLATANQLKLAGKMIHSVRYGGDWKGDNDLASNSFCDMDHYELII